MNTMLARICALLRSQRPDQQVAAAIVLGELRARDPKILKALAEALSAGARPVRLAVLEALGRIASPGAVGSLLPLLEAPDDEIREKATRALVSIGPSAIKPIARHILDAPPPARRSLMGVLARVRTDDSVGALLSLIAAGHPEASREAAQALAVLAGGMGKQEKSRLRTLLEKVIVAPPDKAPAGSLSAALSVIGLVSGPATAAGLLRLTGRKYPEEVRRDALLAIAGVLKGGLMPQRVLDGVLPLIEDGPSPALRSAALEILTTVEIPASACGAMIALIGHKDPAVRRFAARKLGQKGMGGAKVIRSLIPLLGAGDPSLREAASESLARQPEAGPPMVEGLLRCEDIHHAWTIAYALKPHLPKLKRQVIRRVFDSALAALIADQQLWEPRLHVVRHYDPKLIYEWLMEASARFKKARKYSEAEACLRPLSRGDHFDSEARYALALAGIRAARSRAGASSPAALQAIDLFRQLVRDPAFPLVDRLKKERTHLETEDLYHLGFQLTEGTPAEKEVGAELLKLVAARAGSSRIGKSARSKLKAEGLVI